MKDKTNKYIGDYNSADLASLRGFFFPHSYLKEAETEIKDLTMLLGLSKDKTLLDIPCGVASSLHMAREGIKVTGVDLCKEYLVEIGNIAQYESLNYEVVLDDMREFKRSNYYDAIIFLWDSLGLCSGMDDDKKILTLLYENLKHEGKVLLEIYPLETWCCNFGNEVDIKDEQFTNIYRSENDNLLNRSIKFVDSFRRVSLEFTIENNITKKIHKDGFVLRIRSMGEIEVAIV